MLVDIDVHSIFFPYYGSQWLPATVWLPTFFKISSFVFNRRETHTGLEQLVCKYITFSFLGELAPRLSQKIHKIHLFAAKLLHFVLYK